MTTKINLSDFDTPELNARYEKSLMVARALDQQSDLLPYALRYETSDFEEFIESMTNKRLSLLKIVMKKSMSIAELAEDTQRDRSSIRKDLSVLESLGLVGLREEKNPGHGVKKIVFSMASQIQIQGSFEAA